MKVQSFKFLTILFVLSTFIITGFAFAGKKGEEKKPQTTCPVMEGKINKNIYTDYQGQRIYLCCKGCIIAFEKDPEKYMKKIEDENVLLESTQKVCPVTEKPINKKIYKDYKGRRVYFCCSGCLSKFEKEPEKYLQKLDEETKKGKKKGHEEGHKGHGHEKHDH